MSVINQSCHNPQNPTWKKVVFCASLHARVREWHRSLGRFWSNFSVLFASAVHTIDTVNTFEDCWSTRKIKIKARAWIFSFDFVGSLLSLGTLKKISVEKQTLVCAMHESWQILIYLLLRLVCQLGRVFRVSISTWCWFPELIGAQYADGIKALARKSISENQSSGTVGFPQKTDRTREDLWTSRSSVNRPIVGPAEVEFFQRFLTLA